MPQTHGDDAEATYPVVFRAQIVVQGEDFTAGVEFRGGAVVQREPEGFLAHGLKPGGVAGIGATLVEAYLDLKANTELALYDLAHDSAGFTEFRQAVAAFFEDTDPWTETTFASARENVAAGRVISDLPVQPDPELYHTVLHFEKQEPGNNPEPPAFELAGLPHAA